jgi:hypothetical protein
MSAGRVTPEMAAKVAAVREAMSKLQDKHFLWMVDAAMEHFAASVKKAELEILRFAGLPEAPIFTRYGKDRGSDHQGTTREAELPGLRASLQDYYAILECLQALKEAASLRSAEVFAASIDWTSVTGAAPRRRRAP